MTRPETLAPHAARFDLRVAARVLVGLATVIALADLAGLLGFRTPDALADRDFANYWIAARLVLDGQAMDLFSGQPVYFAHMRDAFGPEYPWHAWSYPPHYLLAIWPLGWLGYTAAMAVFLAATLALFLLAARAWVGDLAREEIMLVAPFVLFNVYAAQNGFLFGALMLAALALRYRRPVLAGIFAGCLTVKPQLGILLPLLWLIEGRWTAIASAALTTVGLVMLSATIFGWESWSGYLGETMRYQRAVMDHATGIFLFMMPSLFGSLRSLGVPADPALAAHLALALPALVVALVAFRLVRDPDLRAVVLLAATFLVTPYALAYDLGAFALALVVVSRAATGGRFGSVVVAVAGLLPLAMVPMGILGLPAAPVVLAALLVYVVAGPFREALASRRAILNPPRA